MRTRTVLVPLLAGVALVTTACGGAAVAGQGPAAAPSSGPASPVQLTDAEVTDLFTTWNAALATGDAQQVADLYAPDAVLLSTLSGDVKDTPEEIRGYFADTFLPNRPQGEITESYIAVERPGLATHTGLYDFTVTDPATGQQSVVPARFTYVYSQQPDGRWLISSHHSSKVPA